MLNAVHLTPDWGATAWHRRQRISTLLLGTFSCGLLRTAEQRISRVLSAKCKDALMTHEGQSIILSMYETLSEQSTNDPARMCHTSSGTMPAGSRAPRGAGNLITNINFARVPFGWLKNIPCKLQSTERGVRSESRIIYSTECATGNSDT